MVSLSVWKDQIGVDTYGTSVTNPANRCSRLALDDGVQRCTVVTSDCDILPVVEIKPLAGAAGRINS